MWRGPLPWIAAVVLIAGAIGGSIVASRPTTPAAPGAAAADAAITLATGVPAEVLDRVGAGGLPDPLRATAFETLRGSGGRPLVVYVGAEYCPFCASQKWSLVVALSRFGSLHGLTPSSSSSTDVYPNTPTLSFRDVRYTSDLVELSAVETADREGRPIAAMTAVQSASMSRSDPRGSIPFLSIADRSVAVGSGYRPDVLTGRTWSEIAGQLHDPSSPIARAVLGNANWITAAICRQTGGRPAAVCDSAAVRAVAPSK